MWRLNKTERSQGTLNNKKELRRQDEMMQKKAHKWLGIVDKPVEEEPPAAVRGKKRKPEKKHQKGSSERFQLLQTQQQRKRGRRNWISQTNPTPKKQGSGEGKLKTALVLPKKNPKKRLIKTRKKKRRKKTKNNHQNFHQEQKAQRRSPRLHGSQAQHHTTHLCLQMTKLQSLITYRPSRL